ncbi:MAG: cobalamin-dependent protein [Chloroflexi bacterium]|nr:cobalamin-dependent protein [Chloroflexota bacterium]
MDSENILRETRDRYDEALLIGESALAHAVIEQALGRGLSRADIYLEVLAPSQIRIGGMWHEGRINVAQEHLATSITMAAMDYLRQGMTPRAGLGVRAVVTPVEGDHHSIGARMIADFLAMDGWEVYFLGDGTPAKDLAEFVRQRNVDLVAISSTLLEFLPNARLAADAIRELNSPAPKILLGGASLTKATADTKALGCDATADNVLEAVAEARRLVGLAEERLTLQEQLALMGRRINSARTGRGMTQQALAEASGLDRTYISLVEHGKQNVTIGAVLKIAHALDLPIGDLVASTGYEEE